MDQNSSYELQLWRSTPKSLGKDLYFIERFLVVAESLNWALILGRVDLVRSCSSMYYPSMPPIACRGGLTRGVQARISDSGVPMAVPSSRTTPQDGVALALGVGGGVCRSKGCGGGIFGTCL